MTARDIHQAIEYVLATGRHVDAMCPAHEDRRPSLSVATGHDQPVLLTCQAGCSTENVLHAANLTWEDISTQREKPGPAVHQINRHVVATYDYLDEDGTLLYQQRRYEPKMFVPRHQTNGAWADGLGEVRRVPYRLPQLLDGIKMGRTVWYVEGERDVETLVAQGQVATTTVNGAKSWREEYARYLRGANLHVIADADDAGRALAANVYASCSAAGVKVRVFECSKGKDITEHLANGGTAADLIETVTARGRWTVWSRQEIENYEPPPDRWVIDSTLSRRQRVIVTATEGSGKSEMLRHLALCVSVGVHPFTLASCQPRTVLIVDAENEKSDVDTSWKWLFRVTTKLGHPDVGKLHAVMLTDPADRPDLTDAHGRAALMRNIERIQPELVCLGPLYKLVSSDLTDRASVRYFRDTIDQAREICDSAFVIEHHAPHRMSGSKERELRPIGSSELMRWPDFGFALVSVPSEDGEKLYEWKPWRGGRKRDRQWPSMLREGKPGTLELPWVAYEDVEGSVNVKTKLHSV